MEEIGVEAAWASIPNPFTENVSRGAWDRTVNVDSIHRGIFEKLTSTFEVVAREPGNRSVLIYGPPGSGKTHLLGRFRRWLEIDEGAPDRLGRGVFVYVRLDTNPEKIWQHLRRRLVDDLLRVEAGLTQLQRIIAHELAQHRGEAPAAWVRQLRILMRINDPEISSILEEIEDRAQLGRELRMVLEHLMYGRKRSDGKAWLRGDFLPEEALRDLGVDPSADLTEDAEDRAREVVLSLLRIPSPSLPIVLCFDQIESLQRHPKDQEALFHFGRAAADAFNGASNLLLLSCVQSAFLDQVTRGARKADIDRFAGTNTELGPLGADDATELLIARMDAHPELRSLRESHRGLWPFPDDALEELVAGSDVGPRLFLARASEAFDRLAGRGVTHRPVAELLQEELERRTETAETEGSDLESTIAHGLPLVIGLGVTAWEIDPSQLPKDISVRLRQGDKAIDVAVCNQKDGRAIQRPLKRLDKQFDAAKARLCILRASSRPIPPTAAMSIKTAETLKAKGARFIDPVTEAVSVLEAVRTLLSDARAGDLSLGGRPIEAETVEDWLRATYGEGLGLLPEFIEQLVDRGEPTGGTNAGLDALSALVNQHRVVSLPEAAQHLETSPEALSRLVESAPNVLTLIQGAPPALIAVRNSSSMRLEERVS